MIRALLRCASNPILLAQIVFSPVYPFKPHRKDAKAQRKRQGKQQDLRVKSKAVDSRATFRQGGTNRNLPLFDTLHSVFSAFPLRLCGEDLERDVEKRKR